MTMGNIKKLIFFQWIVISVFIFLIALLIRQNLLLKKSSPPPVKDDSAYFASLDFESQMNSHFLFALFPLKIEQGDFLNYTKKKIENVNGYVIILFDLTVCGVCLNKELKVLESYKNMLNGRGISVLGIIGISNKSEESEILSRYRAGDISLPVKFVNVGSLYSTFQLSRERYLDTPFYIYTSHTFKVYNVLKSQYMDTRRLEKWLELIADQEAF
jgi:hypothetical protein